MIELSTSLNGAISLPLKVSIEPLKSANLVPLSRLPDFVKPYFSPSNQYLPLLSSAIIQSVFCANNNNVFLVVVVSAFFFAENENPANVYPTPNYFQGLNYIAADVEVSKHTYTNSKQGFKATKHVTLVNGEPTEEIKSRIKKKFSDTYTGEGGTKFADFNGSMLTFKGKEIAPFKEVDSSIIAALTA